jgi:hypothetical protein
MQLFQQKITARFFYSWRQLQSEQRNIAFFLARLAERSPAAVKEEAEGQRKDRSVALRLRAILARWRHWRAILLFAHWYCSFIDL